MLSYRTWEPPNSSKPDRPPVCVIACSWYPQVRLQALACPGVTVDEFLCGLQLPDSFYRVLTGSLPTRIYIGNECRIVNGHGEMIAKHFRHVAVALRIVRDVGKCTLLFSDQFLNIREDTLVELVCCETIAPTKREIHLPLMEDRPLSHNEEKLFLTFQHAKNNWLWSAFLLPLQPRRSLAEKTSLALPPWRPPTTLDWIQESMKLLQTRRLRHGMISIHPLPSERLTKRPRIPTKSFNSAERGDTECLPTIEHSLEAKELSDGKLDADSTTNPCVAVPDFSDPSKSNLKSPLASARTEYGSDRVLEDTANATKVRRSINDQAEFDGFKDDKGMECASDMLSAQRRSGDLHQSVSSSPLSPLETPTPVQQNLQQNLIPLLTPFQPETSRPEITKVWSDEDDIGHVKANSRNMIETPNSGSSLASSSSSSSSCSTQSGSSDSSTASTDSSDSEDDKIRNDGKNSKQEIIASKDLHSETSTLRLQVEANPLSSDDGAHADSASNLKGIHDLAPKNNTLENSMASELPTAQHSDTSFDSSSNDSSSSSSNSCSDSESDSSGSVSVEDDNTHDVETSAPGKTIMPASDQVETGDVGSRLDVQTPKGIEHNLSTNTAIRRRRTPLLSSKKKIII